MVGMAASSYPFDAGHGVVARGPARRRLADMSRRAPRTASAGAADARAARTVAAYLAALPPERRAAIEAVRAEVNRRLRGVYEEGMRHGMIGWSAPPPAIPAAGRDEVSASHGYVGLASLAGYMALYVSCAPGSAEHRARFEEAWARTGKRLGRGTACVRFRRLDDLPLARIGEAVARVPVESLPEARAGARRTPDDERAP
jgi:hypothetical protein